MSLVPGAFLGEVKYISRLYINCKNWLQLSRTAVSRCSGVVRDVQSQERFFLLHCRNSNTGLLQEVLIA